MPGYDPSNPQAMAAALGGISAPTLHDPNWFGNKNYDWIFNTIDQDPSRPTQFKSPESFPSPQPPVIPHYSLPHGHELAQQLMDPTRLAGDVVPFRSVMPPMTLEGIEQWKNDLDKIRTQSTLNRALGVSNVIPMTPQGNK